MKKNAIPLKLPTLLLFIELTFISYFEKKNDFCGEIMYHFVNTPLE